MQESQELFPGLVLVLCCVVIGVVTILLTFNLCEWWWWGVCKVIFMSNPTKVMLGMPSKTKKYVDRETVPIPSYPPTIETVSEY